LEAQSTGEGLEKQNVQSLAAPAISNVTPTQVVIAYDPQVIDITPI
jgi:hypothetical protein